MGSVRKHDKRRKAVPLRLAKLSTDSRLSSGEQSSPRRKESTRGKQRGYDGVEELQPKFAYQELPREVLMGSDIDLSTWSMVATDSCIERLAARSTLLESNQVADIVRVMSAPAEVSIPSSSTTLATLNLVGASQLTNRAAWTIAKAFPGLRRLDISRVNQITDAGVLHIVANCRNLRALGLAQLPLLSAASVRAIGEHRLPLRELDISGCVRVPESALLVAIRGSPHLEHLACSKCPGVSDAILHELPRACRALRSLKVDDCSQLSDYGLVSFSNDQSGVSGSLLGGCLEALDMSRRELPYKVTDTALLALGSAFAALRIVNVAGCSALSDVGISWLVERSRGITLLNLGRCVKVTDLGMRAVGENLPQLENLVISECSRITARGLRHVARGCPRLAEIAAEALPLLFDEDERVSTPMLMGMEDGEASTQEVDGIAALAALCSGLKRISLANCRSVGDRSLLALASRSTLPQYFSVQVETHGASRHLLEISVRGCNRYVTSVGVRAVLSSCPQLESFDLGECVLIDDDAFTLDSHLLSLQSLRLGGCRNVSDSTLQSLGRRTQLRTLDLSGCFRISDFGILALLDPSRSESFPASKNNLMRQRKQVTLQRLWLRGLQFVSDTAVAWLAVYCSRLIFLDVTRCASIMDASLIALASNWKFGELKITTESRGIVPIERASDWIVLEDYGDCWRAATRIQSLFRARQARKRAAVLREEALARWVALRLQSAFRGRQARKLAALRRLQRRKETDAAVRVQTRFRERRDARVLAETRRIRREIAEQNAARTVQLAYRLCKLRSRLFNAREKIRLTRERQNRASTLIQRTWRGHFVRKYIIPQTRSAHNARVLREYKAVVTLQTRFRARIARKLAAKRRESFKKYQQLQEKSILLVQRVWRGRRARQDMLELRKSLARYNAAAYQVQRWWKACLRRRTDALLIAAQSAKREYDAAVRLQSAWKRRQGILAGRMLRLARDDAIKRAHDAASRVQRRWRARKEQAIARKEREARMEEIVRAARKLYAAVSKVQAHIRGQRARRQVAALRLARKKARWKLVEQDGDGPSCFYYNTETGEVRLRKPQDVLDLLPVPLCGNCELPSTATADIECRDCGEWFCTPCWALVHAGGRRRMHGFRVLLDANGKRMDYAKDEFPSRWSTELVQDDRNGWAFRTYPFRNPVESVGAWEHYVDNTSGREWFFNSYTRENSYEPPAGVFSPPNSSLGDESLTRNWTRYVDDSGYEYFYNHESGESTYERPFGWEESISQQ